MREWVQWRRTTINIKYLYLWPKGGERIWDDFWLPNTRKKSVADRIENYHIRERTNRTVNIVKDFDEYINGNEKWNVKKNHVSM